MQNYPSYSIGLQRIDGRFQITIKELDLCAVALYAKTFEDATVVANLMLATAFRLEDRQPATPRKREQSAA